MNRFLGILITLLMIFSLASAEKGFYTEQETHTPAIMGQPAKEFPRPGFPIQVIVLKTAIQL